MRYPSSSPSRTLLAMVLSLLAAGSIHGASYLVDSVVKLLPKEFEVLSWGGAIVGLIGGVFFYLKSEPLWQGQSRQIFLRVIWMITYVATLVAGWWLAVGWRV